MSHFPLIVGLSLLLNALVPAFAVARPGAPIELAHAERLARLALLGIDREYPNKPGDVLRDRRDVSAPQVRHPAFFGCFDWHSSVHGHWMLVRLLRVVPTLPNAAEIRRRLARRLTAKNLATEARYFDDKENKSFERMYGWAWALRLATELREWKDPDAVRWSRNLAPLEQRLVSLVKGYLPRLTHPVRTGVHPDTAFALAQILDYARAVGDAELEAIITRGASEYYLGDRDYPARYEPSGEDFLSAGLNVADLMRRVLAPPEFARWLEAFLPGLSRGSLPGWDTPAKVSDLTDPKIVHLVGLNLSRAWTLGGIASVLTASDPRRPSLTEAAARHAEAGLKYVFSGHYEGEHWLGTFAVYLLSGVGVSE